MSQINALEPRRFLAFSAFDPSNGVLTVTGTDAPDVIFRGNGGDDTFRFGVFSSQLAEQNGEFSGGGGRDTVTLFEFDVPTGFQISLDDLPNDGLLDSAEAQANFRSDIEVLTGSSRADRLDAAGRGAGTSIFGQGGNDTLIGSGFSDTLLGGRSADSIDGGAGEDVLRGETGNDTLTGGAGPDSFNGGPGNDGMNAADGESDVVNGGEGLNDSADVDDLLDTVVRVETVG